MYYSNNAFDSMTTLDRCQHQKNKNTDIWGTYRMIVH